MKLFIYKPKIKNTIAAGTALIYQLMILGWVDFIVQFWQDLKTILVNLGKAWK